MSWPDYYRHVPLLTIVTILDPRHYIATQFTVDTTNTILYNIKIIQFVVYNTVFRAIIRCPDNLKFFFAGIPRGPLETSPGTIKKFQKRFQGPPARGF